MSRVRSVRIVGLECALSTTYLRSRLASYAFFPSPTAQLALDAGSQRSSSHGRARGRRTRFFRCFGGGCRRRDFPSRSQSLTALSRRRAPQVVRHLCRSPTGSELATEVSDTMVFVQPSCLNDRQPYAPRMVPMEAGSAAVIRDFFATCANFDWAARCSVRVDTHIAPAHSGRVLNLHLVPACRRRSPAPPRPLPSPVPARRQLESCQSRKSSVVGGLYNLRGGSADAARTGGLRVCWAYAGWMVGWLSLLFRITARLRHRSSSLECCWAMTVE